MKNWYSRHDFGWTSISLICLFLFSPLSSPLAFLPLSPLFLLPLAFKMITPPPQIPRERILPTNCKYFIEAQKNQWFERREREGERAMQRGDKYGEAGGESCVGFSAWGGKGNGRRELFQVSWQADKGEVRPLKGPDPLKSPAGYYYLWVNVVRGLWTLLKHVNENYVQLPVNQGHRQLAKIMRPVCQCRLKPLHMIVA